MLGDLYTNIGTFRGSNLEFWNILIVIRTFLSLIVYDFVAIECLKTKNSAIFFSNFIPKYYSMLLFATLRYYIFGHWTIRSELFRTRKMCAKFYLEVLWKTNSVRNCVFCLHRLNCATTKDRVFGPSKMRLTDCSHRVPI